MSQKFVADFKFATRPPFNRFAKEFVPEADKNVANQLVYESLKSFSRPIKELNIKERKYAQIARPGREKFAFELDRESGDKKKDNSKALSKEMFEAPRNGTSNGSLRGRSREPSRSKTSLSSMSISTTAGADEKVNAADLVNASFIPSLSSAELVQSATKADASGLFQKYQPDFNYVGPAEDRLIGRKDSPLWKQEVPTQLLVCCQRLHFSLGPIEPFYCKLALYDLENGVRISEFFHFDLNTPEVLVEALHQTDRRSDKITKCTNALFSIDDRSPSVVLVLHIDKVLQGDPDAAASPYLSEKYRQVDALSRKVRTAIERLHPYRQDFAFGMCQLFDEYGNLQFQDSKGLIDSLYYKKPSQSEEDFISMMMDIYKDPSNVRKQKAFPRSFFCFSIDVVDIELPEDRVDPSLIPLKKPTRVLDMPEQKAGPNKCVREVEDFPIQRPVIPNTRYVNSMYIYPEAVNFQKHRNITVKIELRMTDERFRGAGMKTIFGTSSMTAFVKHMYSSLNWHTKAPRFRDEVKIMLPFGINEKTHLFFTFYNISCTPSRGKDQVEQEIGFACLPILGHGGLFEDSRHELLIVPSLEDSYLSAYSRKRAGFSGSTRNSISFRSGGDQVFKVRVRTLSTVFSQDHNLNNFFQLFPRGEGIETSSISESKLFESISCLEIADPESLIRFLPPILVYQMKLLATRYDLLRSAAFHGVIAIVHRVSDYMRAQNSENTERCPLLVAWIQKLMDNVGGVPMYLVCCAEWQKALEKIEANDRSDSKYCVQYAWFWFEVIIKSMRLQLLDPQAGTGGRLTALEEFCKCLLRTVELFTQQLPCHRTGFGLTTLKRANNSFALFMSDLFTVMDSNRVFQMIDRYYDVSIGSDSVLLDFQLNFTAIVFDNERLIDICEPQVDLEIPSEVEINDYIAEVYPLPALLIRFVTEQIAFPEVSSRQRVVDVLRHVLTKVDFNTQTNETPATRRATVSMFFPLIASLCDLEEQRLSVVREGNDRFSRNVLSCFLWVLESCDRAILKLWWSQSTPEVIIQFLAFLERSLYLFNYGNRQGKDKKEKVQTYLSPETSAAYTDDPAGTSVADFKSDIESLYSMTSLRNSSSVRRRANSRSGSLGNIKGGTGKNTGSKSGTGTASGTNSMRGTGGKKTLSLRERRARMRVGGLTGSLKKSLNSASATATSQTDEFFAKLVTLEGQLTERVSRVVIVALIDYVTCVHAMPDIASPEVVLAVLSVMTEALRCNLPDEVNMLTYSLAHYFLENFPQVLQDSGFEDQVGAFSRELLRHSSFSNPEMRQRAASLMYIFTKANFQATGNLTAFQLAVTTSLAKEGWLVELSTRETANLQQVQSAITLYAERDAQWNSDRNATEFKKCLSDVSQRIRTIFRDTLEISRQKKLKESMDSARYEDLLIQMATAYSHIPEINITWLQQLSEHHKLQKNYAEAAQCQIAVADLISQRLMHRGSMEGADAGAEAAASARFQKLQHARAGVGETPDSRLRTALQKACDFLAQADLHESCNEVYQRLIPLYAANQQFRELALAHKALHEAFTQLASADEAARLLGSYYRVAFFGTKFGADVDHKQFVYKMPKLTRLPEITGHLKEKYKKQLGCAIKVLPNSANVAEKDVPPDDCYLQITYLHAHIKDEKEKSFIEKNTNITCFKFATPFTASGKAHGDVTAQQKRTTYLYVGKPFPCCRTRQLIVKKEEHILSPVESALDDIQARVDKFAQVLGEQPVDPKVLTGLLSGSILLQVHGGALEICQAFLNPEGLERFDTAEIYRLRHVLSGFLDMCSKGLDVYQKLISSCGADSNEKVLEKQFNTHFHKMRNEMYKFLKVGRKKRQKVRFAD